MEVDLKGNIIRRGLVNLRIQRFEDLSHRAIGENMPKTRVSTLAAMFDCLTLRQQPQQCLLPACKTVIRKVVTESPKTSIYGKLPNGNLTSVKAQSDFRPFTNSPRALTIPSGVQSYSAFKQVSPWDRKLKRTPHFKEQRQLKDAFPQPPRVIRQRFSVDSKQQIDKLQREQMVLPSKEMNENIPILPEIKTAKIWNNYSKPTNFNQRLPSGSAELKSDAYSGPSKTSVESPASVRSSFLTFTAPMFYSTTYPVQPVKYLAIPLTTTEVKNQEEKYSNFVEITKCTVRNFDRNSISLEMKQRISITESLKLHSRDNEVEFDQNLAYGRLNTSSVSSYGDGKTSRRLWSNFEMKDFDSAKKTKRRPRSLESLERKPLRHTSSFHIHTPKTLDEKCVKYAEDMKDFTDSPSKVNFRNSRSCANAGYPPRHMSGECNLNSTTELDSIVVELREKTKTAFRHSNWDTHQRKRRERPMATFAPQTSRRRLGVYGTLHSRESVSSEDSERDDLSSDGSVSSPESQSSSINETLSSDSGVCEDAEDSESKWRISYSLSKLKNTSLRRSPHQLWCHIPEIFNSEFFRKLTSTERKLQEAKFEVITSEISYAKSLNILITHFLESESLKRVSFISDEDKKTLFANIISVKTSTEKFLIDLEKCWRKDASLQGIGEIIVKHAKENFRAYIAYCRNQVHQANTLNHLMKSEEFCRVIQELESDTVCQKLTFPCFLILPMQRVTRIRLLVETILETLSVDDAKYKDWNQALISMNRLVQDCNDAARYESLRQEMHLINKQLDFNLVGEIGLLRSGRHLVKKGELFHLYCSRYPQNLGITSADINTVNAFCLPGFGRKIIKQPIHLFLFTDLMVIAKKKSDENFTVIDYCPREFIEILMGDPGILQELLQRNFSDYKNIFHLFVRKNCQNRKAEMILSAPGETEKELWIKAFEMQSQL